MRTIEQTTERVENLGGFVIGNKAYFTFDQPVSEDGGESISLEEALNIQGKMMDMGYEGALIGTPANDMDLMGIFFEI
jgi:hypothetical protein